MIDRVQHASGAACSTRRRNKAELIVVPALKFREANFVLPKQPLDREPAIGEGVFGAAADEPAAASLVGQTTPVKAPKPTAAAGSLPTQLTCFQCAWVQPPLK